MCSNYGVVANNYLKLITLGWKTNDYSLKMKLNFQLKKTNRIDLVETLWIKQNNISYFIRLNIFSYTFCVYRYNYKRINIKLF